MDCYSFHFMKKDPKTGKWWQKNGRYAIRCLGKVDVDKKKYWEAGPSGYPAKSSKRYYVFYNSKTLYFAVKARFWTT